MLFHFIKRPFGSTFTGCCRIPASTVSHYHKTPPRSVMGGSGRTYADALSLLDTLQSNRMIANEIKQSNRNMNRDAIPEMLDWVNKAGYRVTDFNRLRVIHIAGTKGKGSVCAFVASILQQYSNVPGALQSTADETTEASDMKHEPNIEDKGLGKVGLYTSPHLVTVRERIRIGNDPISQSDFTKHFFTLWDRFSASAEISGHPNPSGSETKPGYFRYLTIMALHVFLQEDIRTAIVECGIGGEFDSTNILTKDAVTVTAITRLGIDHVGMLGDNLGEIAWHKGGIMKETVECFTVPQEPEAMQMLKERAREKEARLIVVKRMEAIQSGDVKIGLEGEFQKDNASLAVAIAGAHMNKFGLENILRGDKLPTEFLRGLEHVNWNGRCEVRKEGNIEWCIDGGHTMESMNITAKWFAEKLQRGAKWETMLIFNQQDRDGISLAEALHLGLEQATGTKQIFINAAFCSNTPFKLVNENGYETGDLLVQRAIADAWSKFEPDAKIIVYSSVEEAVEKARKISKGCEKLLVLVTGSLHLVGGFLKVLLGNKAIS